MDYRRARHHRCPVIEQYPVRAGGARGVGLGSPDPPGDPDRVPQVTTLAHASDAIRYGEATLMLAGGRTLLAHHLPDSRGGAIAPERCQPLTSCAGMVPGKARRFWCSSTAIAHCAWRDDLRRAGRLWPTCDANHDRTALAPPGRANRDGRCGRRPAKLATSARTAPARRSTIA